MDLRLMFNEDPGSYDRFRPTYMEALFRDVIAFSGLDAQSHALEIGIGTGQATRPFLDTGCRLTAVELGDKLAQFTREKFAAYDTLDIINQDFESAPLADASFDLIYSASAFHWIPREVGLPKVLRLLKPSGVFAWFSVQPLPEESHAHIHEEVQKVYSRYSQFFGGKTPLIDPESRQRLAEEKRQDRAGALQAYGFTDITSALYYGTRTLRAADYVTLLSTYSDHKAIPEETRIPFLREIEEAIDRHGGAFTLKDTMLLCMGRKP